MCLRLRSPKRTHPKNCLERPGAFDLVALDYVGPRVALGETWYYLVIIDHATRYVVTSVTKEQSAEHVLDVLTNIWVRCFGPPKIILTDNGAPFTSAKLHTYVYYTLRTGHTKTSPYNPTGNAINEACHQSLERGILSRLANPTIATFGEIVTEVTRGYNAAWQSALKKSPFCALFGKNMTIPGFQLLTPYLSEKDRLHALRLQAFVKEVEPHLPQFPEYGEGDRSKEVQVGDFCVFERPEPDQRMFNPGKSSAHAYGLRWSLPARIMEVKDTQVTVKEYATNVVRKVPLNKILLLPQDAPPSLQKINWEHIKITMPNTWQEPLDVTLLPEMYHHLPPMQREQTPQSQSGPTLPEVRHSSVPVSPQGSAGTSASSTPGTTSPRKRRRPMRREEDDNLLGLFHALLEGVPSSSEEEENAMQPGIKEECELPYTSSSSSDEGSTISG